MKKPTLASCILGATSFVALLCCTPPVFAARLVDVSVVNRNSGERLTPWRHDGKLYVAGTPGDSYAVELKSRNGERVLTVISVDGVNALTGQTAATLQSGYVIGGWQSYSITGWRKSMEDVAQFVFSALPDSYAARTGRPNNVGVIGVAVYRERPASPEPWRDSLGRSELQSSAATARPALKAESESGRSIGAESNRPAAAPALAERRADQAGSLAESEMKSKKLGTGHGAREHSPTRYTEFVRHSDTPDEIVTIYYDSRASLVARGIIPMPRIAEPTPFPGSNGFVPDPRG